MTFQIEVVKFLWYPEKIANIVHFWKETLDSKMRKYMAIELLSPALSLKSFASSWLETVVLALTISTSLSSKLFKLYLAKRQS